MTTSFRDSGLSIFCALAIALAAPMPVLADDTPAPAASDAAQAPAGQASAPAVTAPAPGSPEEMICQREDAPTGTRFGARKVCKTRKEWDAIAREAKAVLGDQQDRALRTNPVPDAQ